jgi:protein-S-isoprenylcysteine O-methyltransferase Ste14
MSSSSNPPRKHDGGLGFRRLLHDLKHRRRKHRQAVGVLLLVVLTILGEPSHPLWGIGTALAILGLGIRLWASGVVVKNEVLATNGPYGFVRHPLYVGNILLGLGFAVACGLWWSYLALAVLLLFFYPATIRYEDRKLHRLFGKDWEEWSSTTRALIPRLHPYGTSGGERAGWSLRLSSMRNGEPLHILIAGLLLGWMYYQIG